MRIASTLAAGSVLFAAYAGSAQAAPVSAQDMLSEYNLIVLGNLTASTETEGSVFVGGDLNASGPYGINPDNMPNSPTFNSTLTVGGDINGEARLFHGDARIGGAINGTLFNNGGGTVQTGQFIDVGAVATAFGNLSNSLSSFASTGGSITGGQNAVFNSVAGGDGIAVFNIDASFFGALSNLSFNTGGITTIVNVTGGDIDLGGGFNFNGAFTDVLFNFHQAATFDLDATWAASILAPFANGSITNGRTQGSVVMASLRQTVEIDTPFDGDLPPREVPVPATLALMLAGLAGAYGARRRSRAKRA